MGPESDLHRKIMSFEPMNNENLFPEHYPKWHPCCHEYDKWAEGAFAIVIDKKKGYYRDFQAINLRISVYLGTKVDSGEAEDSGLPLSRMKVWYVDITDTGGVTPEERVRQYEKYTPFACFIL